MKTTFKIFKKLKEFKTIKKRPLPLLAGWLAGWLLGSLPRLAQTSPNQPRLAPKLAKTSRD